MALKKTGRIEGWNGRTRQLTQVAVAVVDEVSAFYAVMARVLIGRVEDFSDLQAARRLRQLTAAKQQRLVAAKTLRRGS